MPFFEPPTVDDSMRGDPQGRTMADQLFSKYPPQQAGEAVWKDQADVWHQSAYPPGGGRTSTTYLDGEVIDTSGPDAGLSNAKEVYLGGHRTEITDAKATELMAAGFVVGGHWDTMEQDWINYSISSEVNKAYKGGDAAASLLRPGNLVLWTFADNLIGTVTAEGLYIFALPTRNACCLRGSDGFGAISQLYPEGNHPAWNHTDPTNFWWWPLDLINDGTGINGTVFVFCWEVGPLAGTFGHLFRNSLLQLDIFGGRAATYNLESPDETFFIQSCYHDDAAGYHYLTGLEYDPITGGYDNYNIDTKTYSRLARVPIGQLASIATAIEYWNGSAWVASQSAATRIKDSTGADLEGSIDITKVGSTWVLIAMTTRHAVIRLYQAPSPTGPWSMYHKVDVTKPASIGATPAPPTYYAYYQPKFHEHLTPNADHLVATHNRNIFTKVPGQGPGLTRLHVGTFTPQFTYLPVPGAV